MTTTRDNIDATRKVLNIIAAAIFGGGFLALLIGVIFAIGSLLERLPQ